VRYMSEDRLAQARLAAVAASCHLKYLGYEEFMRWNLDAKAHWFCQHAHGRLTLDAAALVDVLVSRGAVALMDQGRLTYDECRLKELASLPPAPEVAWARGDVGFEAHTVSKMFQFSLGYGFASLEAARHLREEGLKALAARWRSEALAAVELSGMTVLADVYAWIQTWKEGEERLPAPPPALPMRESREGVWQQAGGACLFGC
jgi:hypothetical protein